MKKFLTALLCVCLAAFSAVGFAACGAGKSSEAVNLVAITADQVGVADDIDYYVVAEPAASVKVNAIKPLQFAGDLQKLYGGEKGYPQAVIVAKTELATGSTFVSNFLTAVSDSKEWLLSESTSAETVVNAVKSHLTDGMSPTFTAANLNKEVIKNCGINLTYSYDDKDEIKSFIEKFNSVSENSFGTPDDKFFWDGGCDEALYNGNVSVYAPDGAPALGIANLLAGAEVPNDGSDVKYEVVNASLIQNFVTGANPKADICVLPVNLAVKLLDNGEKYKLVATLTHGNLYLLSKDGTEITAKNIGKLRGKTVGVVNLAAVPGLTFKVILENHGIDYVELNG
ncbi:MAG: hypothetical protein K2N22_05035 [Clostridia bacterium]|nr:hypothetical protein [Clostridia bacterium]